MSLRNGVQAGDVAQDHISLPVPFVLKYHQGVECLTQDSGYGVMFAKMSNAENQFGPFFSSPTARSFHRPGRKWLRGIRKVDRIEYASHADVVADGKKTCKTCNS